MAHATPQEIHAFWFGELDEDGLATPEQQQRWFKKDPAFDAAVRERFLPTFEAALAGELQGWRHTPQGSLALVLVLDQFSRNMFRDQARMYAGDALGLAVAKEGLAARRDADMGLAERIFFRMPLMHSEALADQDACVASFEALLAVQREAGREDLAKRVAMNLDYAKQHRDIVAQWGRFPHRNQILGRQSTPEEVVFLQGPGSSF